MDIGAILVLVVLVPLTIWAWRQKPGREAGEEFLAIWRLGPWGKQILVDFFSLELILALWMVSHAAAHGTWSLAVPCIAAMPVLGAMPAALYWLAAAG